MAEVIVIPANAAPMGTFVLEAELIR